MNVPQRKSKLIESNGSLLLSILNEDGNYKLIRLTDESLFDLYCELDDFLEKERIKSVNERKVV